MGFGQRKRSGFTKEGDINIFNGIARWMFRWKKRYFILKDAKFGYKEKEWKATEGDLHEIESWKTTTKETELHITLKGHKDQVISFSREEMKKWVQALRDQCGDKEYTSRWTFWEWYMN